MSQSFDVIVVGARCAGSTLATLLAREGLRVGVVERATFPRDTLSSHLFQAPGINVLGRLGVLDRVRDTGASCIRELDFRQDQFAKKTSHLMRPGDACGFMSVRRFQLDPILAEAAAAAGAEVMMATDVVGLVGDGRVSGVRVMSGGTEQVLSTRLVVGADGRNSTIAKLTGARKYHVVPSERFAYWGFFEGATNGSEPEVVYHHWDGRVVIGCPSDGGLYQVIVVPVTSFQPDFRADLEGAFMDHARACMPVAEKLEGARRVGKLLGIVRWESFFRESAGRGWVLVGDAGQFKDPTVGQGMSDAFRQAAALAPAIAGAIESSDAELDAVVAAWAGWRDRDAFEHHFLASDYGAAGNMPKVISEIMERFDRRGRLDEVIEIFQHRAMPSRVITPPLLLSVAGAMMMRPGSDRREVVREVRALAASDIGRKRLRRRPVYIDPTAHADAGETEVPQEIAA